MRGAIYVVQKDVGLYITGRTGASDYDPFVKDRVVWLPHDAVAYVWILSTYYERLSRRLEQNKESILRLASGREDAERVLKVVAERIDLLLPLSEYKVSKNNIEQKLSDQHVVLKAKTASVKLLEKKLSWLLNKKRLIGKKVKDLMKEYGDQHTAAGYTMQKLVQSTTTHFVSMVMCISKNIPSGD